MEYTKKHFDLIGLCLKRQGFKNLRQYGLPTIFWNTKYNEGKSISIIQRGSCNGLSGDEWRLLTSLIEHNNELYKIDLNNIESSVNTIIDIIKQK